MRQKITAKYLENGSIYIFDKKKFLTSKCRLFGKIGTFVLDSFKKFQLDEKKDWIIVESILNSIKK